MMKPFLLIIALWCFSAAVQAKLVSHWSFNVCALSGQSGEVVDLIGGNNGYAVNGAEIENQGRYCQASKYNGNGEHVNIPHSRDFQVANGTIAFWFRAPQLGFNRARGRGGMGLLSKDSNGTDNGGDHLTIWLDSDGALYIRHQSQNRSYVIDTSDTVVVSPNYWVHLAYSFGSKGMKLYLNGRLYKRNSAFKGGLRGNPEPFVIGANAWSTGNGVSESNLLRDYFKGEIDELRLYDNQLSERRIRDIYQEAQTDCPSCMGAGALISHWPLDVCNLDGSTDEVLDVVGGAHGQALGGSDANEFGKYCQSADFNGTSGHISVGHSSQFSLPSGTISMWFRLPDLTHNSTRGRGGMGLFSKDSSGRDNGGDHLTIWANADGSLFVRHQDTSRDYTISTASSLLQANRWYHLAYVFGRNGMTLYLNGRVAGTNSYTGGLEANPEPIIWGANAWSSRNNGSPANELKDYMRGELDDLRIYNYGLSADEIQTLYRLNEENCQSCNVEDRLEAHWPIDVCALGEDSGEVVDVINGYNGSAIDGVSKTEEGRLCQAAEFDGRGGHINVPNQSVFQARQGSLSLWFNTPDLNHSHVSHRGGQTLFSKDSNGYDGGGHLTIWVLASGQIEIRHQTTSQSPTFRTSNIVSADTWHHLVYTWGSRGIELYFDGVFLGRADSYTHGLNGNREPFIFAANAWSSGDNASPPDQLKDFFKGKMDDLRFYTNQLGEASVSQLYRQSEHGCRNCSTEQLAHYQFEEASWTGNKAVLDSSAASNHADVRGRVAPVDPSEQVACRVLNVPANTRADSIDAINTNIDVNDIGERGTISFWYRSREGWNSNLARQLFDASTELGGENISKYFYLTLRNDGRLDFRLEDNNDRRMSAVSSNAYSYAANEWVHVAVTWDLPDRAITLHLNGIQQSVRMDNEANLSQVLGDMNTLFIGDNRSEYFPGSSSPNSADGEFDDVRIYSYVQSAQQIAADKEDVSTCLQVDHYRLEHDGQGLTCEAEQVVLRACADENCTRTLDRDASIRLEPFAQNVIIPGDVEQQTVTVRYLQEGAVDVSVTNADPQPAAPLRCFTGGESVTCSIEFNNAGLQLVDSITGSTLSNQVAGPKFENLFVRAVKSQQTEDGRPGVCEAAVTGAQSINVSFSCANPDVCKTPLQVNGLETLEDTSSPLNVTFDSDGYASLTPIQYFDAGKINLSVSATIDGAEFTTGQNSLWVIPHQLQLSLTEPVTPFVAGQAFGVTVKALPAEVDGAPKGLPNYQPGNIQLSVVRPDADKKAEKHVYPGDLTFGSEIVRRTETQQFSKVEAITFTNGVAEVWPDYSEVGNVILEIRDQNYASESPGGGVIINGGAPLSLGRFIPAYFSIAPGDPELGNNYTSGTAFSYFGQSFGFTRNPQFTLEARNASGVLTQNFNNEDDWEFLPASYGGFLLDDDNHGEGITLTTKQATVTHRDDGPGRRHVEFNNIQLVYNRPDKPKGELTTALKLTVDADFTEGRGLGICYKTSATGNCEPYSFATIGGGLQRWGRLRLENVFGPETEPKMIPVYTDYFVDDTTGFVRNVDDSVNTVLSVASLVSLSDPQGGVNSVRNNVTVGSADFTLTGGTTLGSSGIKIQQNDTANPVRGSVLIELAPDPAPDTWDDFLSYDWNGEEDGIGNPSATVTFGIYRGNDKIIHWREVFN